MLSTGEPSPVVERPHAALVIVMNHQHAARDINGPRRENSRQGGLDVLDT